MEKRKKRNTEEEVREKNLLVTGVSIPKGGKKWKKRITKADDESDASVIESEDVICIDNIEVEQPTAQMPGFVMHMPILERSVIVNNDNTIKVPTRWTNIRSITNTTVTSTPTPNMNNTLDIFTTELASLRT